MLKSKKAFGKEIHFLPLYPKEKGENSGVYKGGDSKVFNK